MSTIIGLVISFGALIVAFIFEGGVVSKLLQPTAALIVFGGTIGALFISYHIHSLSKVPKALGKIFKTPHNNRVEMINVILQLSATSKREGLLSLEKEIDGKGYDDLLNIGIKLVVDGADEDVVRNVITSNIDSIEEENEEVASVFETAGGYAPTMGVIGTVMGLVNVLANMGDAKEIGAKIAMAFIATLYGVGSANLIWLPIGNKLRKISESEIKTKQMILEGILLLREGSNQSFMRAQLKGYLENEEKEKIKETEQ